MAAPPTRPTLLVLLAAPGDEGRAPGGTLIVNGWRGVRTVLITLTGGEDQELRAALARATTLFGVDHPFHWVASEESVARVARALRAFQPGAVIANHGARPVAEAAWQQAADPAHRMPGLVPFAPEQANLWVVHDGPGEMARIDVSAARSLLRASHFYYQGTALGSAWAAGAEPEPSPIERVVRLAGPPLPPAPPADDLFVGLPYSPTHSPIHF